MEKKLIRKGEQKPDQNAGRATLTDEELERIAGGDDNRLDIVNCYKCSKCGARFNFTRPGYYEYQDHIAQCVITS